MVGMNWKRLLLMLVVLEIGFLIFSIPYFKLNGDEAWFAEESYSMSQNGYSVSNLFSGFIKEDVRVVVQHKLFIYLGAALFKIVHFDLWVFRLIPDLSFLILLAFFVRYQRKYFTATQSAQVLLSIAIILCMHDFFYLVKIARPEMLVTSLGFISFYFLNRFFSGNEYRSVIISGIFAGLAMLAHLNGLIFVASGFTYLLARKKVNSALLFGLASLVAFLPYIVDAYLHLDIFKIQIYSPLVANKTGLTILKPLANLSREHERLFRKPEIIIPSVLFFFHLVVNRTRLFYRENRFLTVYTLLVMVFMGLVVEDKTIKYATYVAPFWAVIIARSILNVKPEKRVLFSGSMVILLVFFITGLYWQASSIFQKEDYPPLNKAIAQEIPMNSTCVAPMNFIFNEMSDYKILSIYLVGYEHFGDVIDLKSLSDFCRQNHCQYAVFNKYGDTWDYLQDYRNTIGLMSNFEIVDANRDFCILKCRGQSVDQLPRGIYADTASVVRNYLSYMAERARDYNRETVTR